MKYYLILIAILIFSSCSNKVIITCSERDAEIFVEGKGLGTGETGIMKIRKKDYGVDVRIDKPGFLLYKETVFYEGVSFKPRTEFCELIPDEAWNASIQSDLANKDFEVQVRIELSEREAWKIVGQVVMNYNDNLEITDMNSGYLKTGWQSKQFSNKTVRTKILVKQSSSEPLKYKVKIISEYSDDAKVSVNDDEKFKEWDRILRAYNELISELQGRLN